MKLVEINPIEFNELACSEPNNSFYQTSNWGKFYSSFEYSPIYIGYKDDKNVYSALGLFLLSKKESFFSSREAICPFGFLINYYDTKLLESFTVKLKKYLSKKGVSTLTINPNVPYITTRSNNDLLIKNLAKLGYTKTKNNCIYTVKIDKTANPNIIDGTVLDAYEIIDDERRQKLFKTNTNYKYLYEAMGDLVKFIVCEINIDKSVKKITKYIEECKHYIEIHQDDFKYDAKREKKAKLIDNQKYLELLNKCKNELGDSPILAVTCLIEFNHKIYKLFTDDKKDYAVFNALQVLEDRTLKTICWQGYDSFDCFTSCDDAQKTELIGEFTYRIK